MFNMPVGQYTPEMLVEMAKSSFRPPQAVGMGGGAQQAAPGFNMGQGMAAGLGGLAKGLGGLMHPAGWVPGTSGSEPGRTTGDADLGGYGASPMDPMGGNPNAVPEIFAPGGMTRNQAMDAAYATGQTHSYNIPGGGFGDWWRRNIGGLF